MRSFFLLALICAISTVAYSQNRYVAGSIVHQDGSKETGWIQNGEWQISPELIKFKKTETSKAKKYEPKDLVSFSVENGLYFTRKIEIENSTFRVKNLTYDSEFKITEKHAFVQLLVDGDKKLFKYVTKSDNNLFYIEKDGELEILLFKKYFEDKDGKRFVREKKNYVSQLYTLLEDCDNVRAWVQDIKYTEGGLTKLFQDYHECIGSKTLYVKAKPSYGLRFSVLGGFSQNDMYFDAFSPKYIIDAEFNSNLGYIGGLGLEIVFPQFGKRWSLQNELAYGNFTSTADVFVEESINYTVRHQMSLDFDFLALNSLIRCRFRYGALNFYGSAGIAYHFVFIEEDSRIKTRDFSGTITIDELTILDSPFKEREQALNLGAGIEWNNLAVEFRYLRGTGISPYFTLKHRTRRYQVIAMYSF